MVKWSWWFTRGIIFSVIIFAILYLFVNLNVIPNLWEGYLEMFNLTTIIIISIVCGFIFVTIHDLFFRKKDNVRGR